VRAGVEKSRERRKKETFSFFRVPYARERERDREREIGERDIHRHQQRIGRAAVINIIKTYTKSL
jgi:hypothetical protein